MGKRTIIVALSLAAALCGTVLWLARTPVPNPGAATSRPAQTATASSEQTDSARNSQTTADITNATEASAASAPDDADNEQRAAKTILNNILLRDFFSEVGIAARDVEMFRRLLDDPTSATFEALLARSENDDPQATTLLHLLNKELCPTFTGFTNQPNWKEDLRIEFERQSYEYERLLPPVDLQRFVLVTDAFLDMAQRVSEQCRDGADAMRTARGRLPQFADDGDTVSLMILARYNDVRRESLIAILHELPDDELVTASNVIGRTANGCDAFEVRLGVLSERAHASPAISAALGRLYKSSCLDDRVTPQEAITHWRAGAYLGSTDSADAYLEALAMTNPAEQRIEAFAIQSFFAELNRLGCMGGDYFDILSQQNNERALTRGLHLSPYENDVALARAQSLWNEHSRAAMAHHHCTQ